jgi:RsiW-degrading membrane proteinase PrsW (M82 family)/RNA polymerase subunit RPABC4/transcription elongation factor Spt4
MLKLLLIPVLGLAPGLLWLWLIYRNNKNRPEPKGLVIRTYLLGLAVTIPVSFVEAAFLLPYIFTHLNQFTSSNVYDLMNNLSTGQIAYLSFIVAGFTEELFKFLVVRTTIYKSPYYDEPLDGLVYSSAAALGFASLENVEYLLQFGWQTALVRAPLTTMAHVVFSAMWGYPLALKKLKKKNSTLLLWLGLAGAMAGHGMFDFLAFQQTGDTVNIPVILGLVALFGGLVTFFIYLIKRGQKTSPYIDKNAELIVACPECQTHIPYYVDFCPSCGANLAGNRDMFKSYCGKCGSEVPGGTNFCTTCGSRLSKKPEAVKLPPHLPV